MADGTMEEPTEEVSDDGRRKLMEMMDEIANATDAMMNDTMMNGTMMNGTMNATEEGHDHEGEGEKEVSDDGRRKLMQLEGLQEAAMGAVDKAKDVAMNVGQKVNETVANVGSALNATATRVNETVQSGLDRVNDFVEGIQGGADNATDNSTMMNDTMMNDTMDMIDGTMEEP